MYRVISEFLSTYFSIRLPVDSLSVSTLALRNIQQLHEFRYMLLYHVLYGTYCMYDKLSVFNGHTKETINFVKKFFKVYFNVIAVQ